MDDTPGNPLATDGGDPSTPTPATIPRPMASAVCVVRQVQAKVLYISLSQVQSTCRRGRGNVFSLALNNKFAG